MKDDQDQVHKNIHVNIEECNSELQECSTWLGSHIAGQGRLLSQGRNALLQTLGN